MTANELRSKIEAEYDSIKAGGDNVPPWVTRKARALLDALQHPNFRDEIDILLVAHHENVYLLRNVLVEYFVRAHGVSKEVAESLVLCCSGEGYDIVSPTSQVDGVGFDDNDDDPFRDENAYVNIRIGHSATKQDVEWFVEHKWQTDIEPKLERPAKDNLQARLKPKAYRDSVIYMYRTAGKTYSQVQELIEEIFGEFVEETLLRKIYERMKPKHAFFGLAIEQYNRYPRDFWLAQKVNLVLVADDGPPYFALVIM